MSIEIIDNESDSTQIDEETEISENEKLSQKYLGILEEETSILCSVDKYGLTEDFTYKVYIDPENVEPASYMVSTILDPIRDAGFGICVIDFEDDYILVEPESVVIDEITKADIRRIFDDPMAIAELEYIDGAYDIQLDGRKPIDSEMIDELRNIGYKIADITATYECTGLPYKYVAIKPIE